MKSIAPVLILAACIFFSSCKQTINNSQTVNQTKDTTPVIAPPASLNLDPFYKKYLDANGIPVISSWRVPDSVLLQAKKIIVFMTKMLPTPVYQKLIDSKVRLGVMSRYEGTTDIPEHRHLANDTSMNWDVRARGLGGDLHLPLTTCAEENIMCYQIDKYHAEDILIHEFAHTIHLVGIIQVDSDINQRLQKVLDKSLASGKWKKTYAATNVEEFWAEAVQDWFNVNAEVPKPDGKHNHVNTRKELKEYDPDLYAIIKEYFPETNEMISCHSVPFEE